MSGKTCRTISTTAGKSDMVPRRTDLVVFACASGSPPTDGSADMVMEE